MPDNSEVWRRLLQADTREDTGGAPPVGTHFLPGLTILHHPDLERVGERVVLLGVSSGREELLSRGEPAFSQPGASVLRPIADPYLSRRPIRLSPGAETGSVRLERCPAGPAMVADGEPVEQAADFSPERLDRGVVLLMANRIVLLLSRLDPVGAAGHSANGLVGESASMHFLRREIQRTAGLEVPVLLRGETGTGKELIARALHEASPRRSRPYLAVNMAAVPPALAAAELFGAARGAFTGADQKRDGYFQRADGGTLFLDEIGEISPEVQALLLRVLETGEIQPVGGGDLRQVDVRLIAATDADLEAAVAAGRFRAPLLHRIAGYEIRVPPLRERRDDFGRLFVHFLRQELDEIGESHRLATALEEHPWIPAGLLARLAALDWPGNVRQLRNAVRQIVIAGRDAGEPGMWLQAERLLQESGRLSTAVNLDPAGGPPTVVTAPLSKEPRRAYRRSEDVTEEELLAALRANRWRIQRAARQLGMSRPSLYSRIEKSVQIRKAVDLSREEIEQCLARCQGDLDAMVERLEVSKRGLQLRMKQLGLS